MYRLTLDDPKTVSGFLTHWSRIPRRVARVYRWGAMWGFHFPATERAPDVWIAELRTPIASDVISHMVLEAVEDMSEKQAAPPVIIDDVWDEELVLKGQVLCGNSWSFVGTAEEVKSVCAEIDVVLPTALKAVLEAAPPAQSTPSTALAAPRLHAGPQERRLPPRPRPGLPHRSTHAHGPHPPRRPMLQGGPPSQGHARPHVPPREYNGQPRNGLLLTPGPVGPRPFPRASGPPRPGSAHAGAGPRPNGWNPRGPRPFEGGAQGVPRPLQATLTKV